VSLALAAAALAAAAAAGVIAAPLGSRDVADERAACSTLTQGAYHVFDLGAGPTRPATTSFRQTAQLIISTGGDTYYGTKLLALDAAAKGYQLNKQLCSSGPGIPLEPRGLPLARTYAAGSYSGREFRCVRPGKVAFRARIVLGSKGQPASARVAVEMARTHAPVLYVEWSPKLVKMWATPRCTDSDF